MKYVSILLCLLPFLLGCKDKNTTDKYPDYYSNVVGVHDKIVDIKNDILLGAVVRLDIIDEYLLVTDFQSIDKGVHLYDKNTYEYISSAIVIGRGPGEIVRIGPISINHENKTLLVPEYGREAIYGFPVVRISGYP